MIDNLAIAIAHSLMALAVWRLARSDGLDADPGSELSERLSRRHFSSRKRDG